LRRLADAPAAEGEAAARNALRTAAELAARLLPPAEAIGLLTEWARQGRVQPDAALRGTAGRQLLRLLLLCPRGTCDPAEVLGAAAGLLGADPLLGLVREWLDVAGGVEAGAADGAEVPPIVALWRAAVALRDGPADPAAWRERVAA